MAASSARIAAASSFARAACAPLGTATTSSLPARRRGRDLDACADSMPPQAASIAAKPTRSTRETLAAIRRSDHDNGLGPRSDSAVTVELSHVDDIGVRQSRRRRHRGREQGLAARQQLEQACRAPEVEL